MKLGCGRWRDLVTAVLLGSNVAAPAAAPTEEPKASKTLASLLDHEYPRLVVVMSFDQFRTDYLTRFSDLYLPATGTVGNVGGFRWLMEHGAFYIDAHFQHLPTHTGPGHATILTGASPSGSGIIANEWLTTECQRMYCVEEDDDVRPVGGPRRPTQRASTGPRNLIADTVGDVLRQTNNRQSKVYGIGIKDRAAILTSGHNPNGVVWYDSGIGRWVTSSYYTTGSLPMFAEHANNEHLADRWVGKTWDYLLPAESYVRSQPEGFKGVGNGRGLGETFPKPLSTGSTPDQTYYERLPITPYGVEMLFETAKYAVEDEALGADTHPDILCLNFSTTDLIGHTYGPHSPEAQDCALRSDRYLSDFLNYLRSAVPGGLDSVLIVLTADHGGAPLPEWTRETMHMDTARIDPAIYATAANEALAARFPDKHTTGLLQISEPYIYFRQSLATTRGVDLVEARIAVADKLRTMPGIEAVFTRDQILRGELTPSRTSQAVYNGFHPERSGDVFLVWKNYYYASRSPTGTTHGTPFNYDTNVPILFAGENIKPGLYTDRVDVRDIAPTLSTLLGIEAPSRSQGRILGEMFR